MAGRAGQPEPLATDALVGDKAHGKPSDYSRLASGQIAVFENVLIFTEQSLRIGLFESEEPIIRDDLRSLRCEVKLEARGWRPALIEIDDLVDWLLERVGGRHISIARWADSSAATGQASSRARMNALRMDRFSLRMDRFFLGAVSDVDLQGTQGGMSCPDRSTPNQKVQICHDSPELDRTLRDHCIAHVEGKQICRSPNPLWLTCSHIRSLDSFIVPFGRWSDWQTCRFMIRPGTPRVWREFQVPLPVRGQACRGDWKQERLLMVFRPGHGYVLAGLLLTSTTMPASADEGMWSSTTFLWKRSRLAMLSSRRRDGPTICVRRPCDSTMEVRGRLSLLTG